jgi:phosphoenolpyruvate carboxylase
MMDAALETDVRLLAQLLEDILSEQEGPWLATLLKQVIECATRARSGSADDAQVLRKLLGSLDSEQALPLARAFSHFLALANMAEQHHRIRMARARKRSGQRHSKLVDVLKVAMDSGMSADALHEAVRDLRVELVMTAHPTQTMRRTLVQKHRRIATALARRDHPDLLPEERAATSEALKREILALWQTDELRRKRLTPLDEARAGLVLFDQILWDALPQYVRELDRSLIEVTGQGLPLSAAPVRFGSWMGGDRDGNPNVTAPVTERVCLLSRWEAAELYYQEIEYLHDELSMTRASPELTERVDHASEPYRALMKQVLGRLGATQRYCETQLSNMPDTPADAGPEMRRTERAPRSIRDARPYEAANELWEPLALCDRSLREMGAAAVADGRLSDLLRRVAAFGIAITRLDIRQESTVHARALDAITRALDLGSYLEWEESKRIEFLVQELQSKRPLLPRELPDDPVLIEALETLRACARQPQESLGAYVISMAHSPSDVLAVHLLQRECGVQPPLRVVPLFETLDDLERAGQAIGALLAVPWYRAACGGEQEVMIGYSDSTKDAGRVAAAWALFRAQEDVVAQCKQAGVKATLFHGRGGTIGRGGGPIYLAILSQPPGSVDGRLRVTIQGETIETLFGLPDLAVESLELYVNASLDATLHPPAGPTQAQRELMQRMARLAAAAYRRVVRSDPSFLRYFEAATPINELGRLNIGSRPAKRAGKALALESLRAIPWIFAWTQTRLHLPAWLGTGEALTTLYEEGEEAAVRQLAKEWPFFRSLLDLLEMVLCKADTDIAAYYDRVLVPDELRALGQELRASCRRTVATIVRAKGEEHLLAAQPELRSTLELRNPYVDPLNVLQAELLQRARQSDDQRIWDALLVTVNGIAAGMRNTG